VGTWVSIGYFAGNHIGTIYHYINLYSYYVLIALVVVILGYIAWRLRRRRRRHASAVVGRTDETRVSKSASEAEEIAPDRSEVAGAAPDDQEAEGIAPTEYPAGQGAADRHAPDKS
jgi:hypothetical protein